MPAFINKAKLPFLSILVLLVAVILLTTVFIAPYWFRIPDQVPEYIGLWRFSHCENNAEALGCYRYDIQYVYKSWIDTTRVLEILAMIIVCVVLVSIPAYIYAGYGLHYRVIMITFAISTLVSGILNILGAIVAVANASDIGWKMSWCVIVCLLSGAFTILGSLILFACAVSKKPQFNVYKPFPELYIDPYKPTIYKIDVGKQPSIYGSRIDFT